MNKLTRQLLESESQLSGLKQAIDQASTTSKVLKRKGVRASITSEDYGVINDGLSGESEKLMLNSANMRMYLGGFVVNPDGSFDAYGNDPELSLENASGLDLQAAAAQAIEWASIA